METPSPVALGHAGSGRLQFVAAALAASLVPWLGWRVITLPLAPIPVAVLIIELLGWGAVAVTIRGVSRSSKDRRVVEGLVQSDTSYRYPAAVADLVGRTRSDDLRFDLGAARNRLRVRPRRLPDLAMLAVLVEGIRRIALVLLASAALLASSSPIERPPWWAALAGLVAMVASTVALWIGSAGRVVPGDRLRWSFAAMGEVAEASDRPGLAPRRWVGTVAAVVVLNLAIALRGISDRWTHGLAPMSADDRLISMLWAISMVAGGLYTLRTMPTPRLNNAHLIARRFEERTARQMTLGAAVCLGMVGLIAGVLPDEPNRSVTIGVDVGNNVDTGQWSQRGVADD